MRRLIVFRVKSRGKLSDNQPPIANRMDALDALEREAKEYDKVGLARISGTKTNDLRTRKLIVS